MRPFLKEYTHWCHDVITVKVQGGYTGTFGMLSRLLRGGHIPIFSFLLILSNLFSQFYWPKTALKELSPLCSTFGKTWLDNIMHYIKVYARPITRGAQGGKAHLENFSPSLEKCVGYSLKVLDTVQKIWASLRKFFAPPGVPSWLRAWFTL